MESVLKTSLPVRTAVIAFRKADLTKKLLATCEESAKSLQNERMRLSTSSVTGGKQNSSAHRKLSPDKNSQKINNSALPSVKGIRDIEFFW